MPKDVVELTYVRTGVGPFSEADIELAKELGGLGSGLDPNPNPNPNPNPTPNPNPKQERWLFGWEAGGTEFGAGELALAEQLCVALGHRLGLGSGLGLGLGLGSGLGLGLGLA